MNVIYLILCGVILQVQAKKLYVCTLKKHKLNDVKQAELSSKNSYLKGVNDEIYIPGNFSSPLFIEDLISANASISNLTISGFLNYTLKLLPIVFTLNALKIQGDNYQIRGGISDLFDLYGDGKFEINLEQIEVRPTNLFPSWPLGCFTFNLDMKLNKMKVKFDNIMGGDDLLQPVLNVVIGDMGPDIIDHYWPLIYDTLQPVIQRVLDDISKKTGMKDNYSIFHLSNETVQPNEAVGTSLKILSDLLTRHL